MSTGPIKFWTDRLLEIAMALVAIGLLLNWAWQLIRPLVPILAITCLLYGAIRFAIHRSRYW